MTVRSSLPTKDVRCYVHITCVCIYEYTVPSWWCNSPVVASGYGRHMTITLVTEETPLHVDNARRSPTLAIHAFALQLTNRARLCCLPSRNAEPRDLNELLLRAICQMTYDRFISLFLYRIELNLGE